MGDTRDKPVGIGENPYIWLRYTTQFTTGGRTHTIEMGIPMPLGASAETREQLIREAEAGMDQLSRHIENRVTQMLQRNARPQGQPIPPGISSPLQPSASSPSRPPTPNSSTVGTPQSSSSLAPPSARPNTNVGASMPLSPNMPGEAGGNIKLSQFMHYIREAWGLTPKQAMELLNVKTLNGLNYRDALKQLQPLVAGDQGGTSTPPGNVRDIRSAPQGSTIQRVPTSTHPGIGASQGNGTNSTPPPSPSVPARPNAAPQSSVPSERDAAPQRDRKEVKEATQSPASHTGPQITFHRPDGVPRSQASPLSQESSKEVKEAPQRDAIPPIPTPASSTDSSKIPIIPISSSMVRDAQNTYRFDEEDDSELELDEVDDNTEQQQIMARIKLDELKEVRGSSTASPGRLTALQNVTNSQISETQMQQLIRAAWGATSLKKLKVDQVEALISWAKEDLFVDEVEAVLALIAEEDSYARSDW